MGSSSSAQRSASSSRSDSLRTSASTPRLQSREGFREVQLGALGQPAAVAPSGGASVPRSSPAPARPSTRNSRYSAMAQPEGLQRQNTFGFSSAQPSYTVRVSKLVCKQEGLAVASIARDDPSTFPGNDPSPLPGMHRDHSVRKCGSEFET